MREGCCSRGVCWVTGLFFYIYYPGIQHSHAIILHSSYETPDKVHVLCKSRRNAVEKKGKDA